MTASSTIANEPQRLPMARRGLRNSWTTLDYQLVTPPTLRRLLYAGGHAADYRKIVALGTVDVSCDLDFCPPHVYPEACQTSPQVDRDAVIVFLGD